MESTIEAISELIFMEDTVKKSDVILIPGASQPELMLKAIELYEQNYSKYILVSGSYNRKLCDGQTEAEFLAQIAYDKGIPRDSVLVETDAKHTFENASYSLKLLDKKKISVNRVILVCKAYHSRRAYMTYKAMFPRKTQFIVQPIVGSREIEKSNWMTSSEKIECVMGELSKIGKYFPKYLLELNV